MSNVHKQAGTTLITVANPDFLGTKVQTAGKTRFSKEFTEMGGDGATITDVDHDLGTELSLELLALTTTNLTNIDIGTIVQYNIDGLGDYMYKIKSVSAPKPAGEAVKFSVGLKGYDCVDTQAAYLADATALDSDGNLINP